MNTMKWLIRREYWENKGMLLWLPLGVAGSIVALALAAMAKGHHLSLHLDGQAAFNGSLTSLAADEKLALVQASSTLYPAIALPLFILTAFLALFYCLHSLHDERRDRSILFWKSLPISDEMTVLSKAALALVVLPFTILVIALATSLLILLLLYIALAMNGVNLFGSLLSTPDFYLTPLRLLSLLPVYTLWALPAVGWLLLVSSWARTKVFLWGVIAPLLTAGVLGWASKIFGLGVDMRWIFEHLIARMLVSVAPGSWFLFDRSSHVSMEGVGPAQAAQTLYATSWSSLAMPTVWIGAVAGVLMIVAAIRIRRWREEG
ncbi:hypothetical protein [Massilia sp. erpn]|uniref:hypothetical protein n=1 Tax=Massilia sp. erpn TaxID=2738142 RepID=UPI0021048E5E|nr:hypothetical protein [Massilia sp. erpn]UTY60120.1 hypothetical protein HPQ68_24785 [Massilia sp. erpn]